ncbi:FG-GAP repeat protein [Streptomyces winkii]|uniref:FG-GAP repeat protein n=1 Tax=Streptomyces winkii TaxID=3051178 RepID=UPI0028D340A2|nr:FG-GAP repeat protein [Streptomyces sp. DSM 40971]
MTRIRKRSGAPTERRPRTRKERVLRAAALPAAALLLMAGGLTAWSPDSQEARPAAEKPPQKEDFNGDGYADLVAGAPGGTVAGKEDAGYVAVTYGSAKGLDPSHKKVVSRSTSGVPGPAAAKQEFGTSFSKGDLDGDGYGDLVVGSTDDGSADSVILWGSSKGLSGGTAIPSYGVTPQIGYFDGDSKADLALLGYPDPDLIGDPPAAQPAALWKGPVSRKGTPAKRLDFLDESEWDGGILDFLDESKAGEEDTDGPKSISGPSMTRAVGDVNGDNRQDIALWLYYGDGVYDNDVLLGGDSGFTLTKGPWGDDSSDMDLGDVDGDGYDDLVMNTGDDMEDEITVAFGTRNGLSGSRRQTVDQSLDGFPTRHEEGDMGGSCVSVADVTGDGRAEVALGISGKDVDDAPSGALVLLHGSKSGVTGTGSQAVDQSVSGVAEKGQEFGTSCALLDVDGDGHRDLNVSATEEDVATGAVWSLHGTGRGLTTKGATAFGPDDLGAPARKAFFGTLVR